MFQSLHKQPRLHTPLRLRNPYSRCPITRKHHHLSPSFSLTTLKPSFSHLHLPFPSLLLNHTHPLPFLPPLHSRPIRAFTSISTIPPPLLIPLIFTSLLVVLWTYKCLMMIIFQNKIIYMPSMPPFARSERIADYAAVCRPVLWREERVKGRDGVDVALAVGGVERGDKMEGGERGETGEKGEKGGGEGKGKKGKEREIAMVYFQGLVKYSTCLIDQDM